MIGGNITASIQTRTTTLNEIGEREKSWTTVQQIKGFLDLASGDSKYTTYNAKIQESTHVFIADYQQLDSTIKAENSRLLINGEAYDVMLFDDPMGLHKQLEIFLQFRGGQNGIS